MTLDDKLNDSEKPSNTEGWKIYKTGKAIFK